MRWSVDGSEGWEIVRRSAAHIEDLANAPGKVLFASDETVAAPMLLYLDPTVGPNQQRSGIYYLATEINAQHKEWQTKVFTYDAADGDFKPVPGNPVLRGGRACLFQLIFS